MSSLSSIGSIFYGTPNASAGFFAKGSVLFFAILLNALISISEINALYDQRPIVEKQASYAFYHPWTEALGGVVSDAPVRLPLYTNGPPKRTLMHPRSNSLLPLVST